jgi:hypothetical protein
MVGRIANPSLDYRWIGNVSLDYGRIGNPSYHQSNKILLYSSSRQRPRPARTIALESWAGD